MSSATSTIPTSKGNPVGAFPALYGQKYINLTTYRKSGEPVTVPVWFVEQDGKLYVITQANAGKVKRIRRTGRVQVAPATIRGQALGPSVDAQARELPPAQHEQANAWLNQKYGWVKAAFDLAGKLRPKPRTFLEINPA